MTQAAPPAEIRAATSGFIGAVLGYLFIRKRRCERMSMGCGGRLLQRHNNGDDCDAESDRPFERLHFFTKSRDVLR